MDANSEQIPLRRAGLLVFTVSMAAITIQVVFVRLLSAKLHYHFVFLTVAASLLGLGIAGSYCTIRRPQDSLRKTLPAWLGISSALVPSSIIWMSYPAFIPDFTSQTKLIGPMAFVYALWCSIPVAAINFTGGVVQTRIFESHRTHVGRIYAYDLTGAGAGGLLALAGMKATSPSLVFLLVGSLYVLCNFLIRPAWNWAGVFLLCAAAAVAPMNNFGDASAPWFQVIKSEWDHLIRTDHIVVNGSDFYYLDGDASTPVAMLTDKSLHEPPYDPIYMITPPGPSVAVIGFGGGLQVLDALRANARSVWAADINPTIAKWVLGPDQQITGGLFTDPRIELQVGEGRNLIRQSHRQFDVISMHAVDTWSATAAGAYSLSENFLYTKEAIADYMDRLAPNGIMSISRWLFNPPRENLRLFATILETLSEQGHPHPEKHIVMIAPVPDYEFVRQTPVWGLLMFSRAEFSKAQLERLRSETGNRDWTVLYEPGSVSGNPFVAYVNATDRAGFASRYPFTITPATDSAPYFFQLGGLRKALLHRATTNIEGIYQNSLIILPLVCILTISAGIILIWLPVKLLPEPLRQSTGKRELLALVLVGLGYMFVELPMIQAFSLYLGHPVYGHSIVLVILLITSGLGSYVQHRLAISARTVFSLLAGALLLTSVCLYPCIHTTLSWAFPLRCMVAVAWTGSLGFLMGIPLPRIMARVSVTTARLIPLGWATNATASVAGCCLATLTMVWSDNRVVLMIAGMLYFLPAFLVIWPSTATGSETAPCPPA